MAFHLVNSSRRWLAAWSEEQEYFGQARAALETSGVVWTLLCCSCVASEFKQAKSYHYTE